MDPAQNKDQRSPQPFSVTLPQPASGSLRLVTRPAHPENNSFNYTYWGELAGRELRAVLAAPDRPVPYSEIEAHYGYDELDEGGRKVLFAHAPSRIVFPLPRHFTRCAASSGSSQPPMAAASAPRGARFLSNTRTRQAEAASCGSALSIRRTSRATAASSPSASTCRRKGRRER
ncbi:MAG: hypothetical protein WDM96_02960 [Lacunisphaera sp.]